LKGKTIAFTRGSNAHFFLIRVLQQAHLTLDDVKQANLSPTDARAAFENGSIDAWAIWDPFYAEAELNLDARLLADGAGIVDESVIYSSTRTIAQEHHDLFRIVVEEISKTDDWMRSHPDLAAQQLSNGTSVPLPIWQKAIARRNYGVIPINAELLAKQQAIADVFYSLGLFTCTRESRGRVAVEPASMSAGRQTPSHPLGSAKARWNWLDRAAKWGVPWLVPALAIAFWQFASQTGFVSLRVLPAPTAVLRAAVRLSKSGELLIDVRASTLRVGLGFVIGGAIGLTLGVLSGQFRVIPNLVDGTLQMIRNIPHLAVLPLVILWFGIGEQAKILLVVLGVFFPVYLNAYHGVRNVDPQLVEMARVYGLRGLALFRHVTLPGALPQ